MSRGNEMVSKEMFVDTTSTSLDLTNFDKSDDDIETLLRKMESLLSPSGQPVLDSNVNKSVEDILKAADELVHSSSPLFEALSPIDSLTSLNLSNRSLKLEIPQIPLYDETQHTSTQNKSLKVNKENNNISNPINKTNDVPNSNWSKSNLTLNINKQVPSNKTKFKLIDDKKSIEKLNSNEANDLKNKTLENISAKHQKQDNKATNEVENIDKQSKRDTLKVSKIAPNTTKSKYEDENIKLNLISTKQNVPLKPKVISSNTKEIIKDCDFSNIKNETIKIDKFNNTFQTESDAIPSDKNDIPQLENNTKEHKTKLLPIQSDNKNELSLTKNNDSGADSNDRRDSAKDNNTHLEKLIRSDDSYSGNEKSIHYSEDSSNFLDSLTIQYNTKNEINNVKLQSFIPKGNNIDISNLTDRSVKYELRMSDLVTPNQVSMSLEQELELQKNKVLRLKEELNNTIKCHLHQLESLKVMHEEDKAMLKKEMAVSQEVEIRKRLFSKNSDELLTPLDDQLMRSYDKENKKLCEELKYLKIQFREAENTWKAEKSKLLLLQDKPVVNVDEISEELTSLKLKIIDLNEIIQSKNAEITKLSTELKSGNATSVAFEETKITLNNLKTQLTELRTQLKSVTGERDILMKDNYDLRRQVKELEIIVKKRNTFGCLTITGQEFFPEIEKVKQLECQLKERDDIITKLTADVESKSNQKDIKIEKLENEMKLESENFEKIKTNYCKEIENLKKLFSKKGKDKEDAHLLATIRGLQSELLNKEKMMTKMNKELDDVKKTNKTLQKEREKLLSSKNDSKHSSTGSLKSCAGTPVESSGEISKLKDRIKELEDDIITLHEKEKYELESIKEQHLVEINAIKSTQGNIAELEGQIYTQEIIINHLKQKLVELESLQNNNIVLKLENEKLEKSLTQANSTITKLSEPPTSSSDPSCSSSQNVLSKIDYLEKRHDVREKTLQAIIHELLSDKKTNNNQCLGDCHSKLLDKNREICYYRAEMNRILDSLKQYKQTNN